MTSTLLFQEEGFSRYPSSIRRVIEQKTPSLIDKSVILGHEEPMNSQEGEDVETVIINSGLNPKEKILTANEEGYHNIRFSKCTDNNGNLCLIEHDEFGYSMVNSRGTADLYEEKENNMDIISSLKNQVVEMAKKHSCMLSISTGNGYYIVGFSSETQKELFFSKVRHRCQKGEICEVGELVETDIETDKIIILPVFKLSELKAQKDAILKKIEELTLHILCISNKLAEEKNKEFQCSLDKINEYWKKSVSARNSYIVKLHERLYKLECLIKEMESHKDLMECNKEKYLELKKKYSEAISDFAKFNTILISSFELVEHAKILDDMLCSNLEKLMALEKGC